MIWTMPVGRVRRLLWMVVAVLVAAHAALTIPDLPLGETFDLDAESGPGTWFTTMLLAATALAFALLAGAARRAGRTWIPIAVSAAVSLALSAEEVMGLHERASYGVGDRFGTAGNVESGTPIIGLLALPAAVIGMTLLCRCLAPVHARRVALGAAVWYAAVFGVEQLESSNTNRSADSEDVIEVDRILIGLQEALEMFGVVVVLAALADEIVVNEVTMTVTFTARRAPGGRSRS